MVTQTPAQVWARDRRTGEMVHLPDGAADALREHTRAHLECPVPGCHGELTTRGGSRRRHHFVHLRTPDARLHTPETIAHAEGKALLADWAARQPGVATVHVECRLNNGRVPDVLVVWDSGELLDLEMECKVADPDGRVQRDQQLRAEGIETQWVWGATALRSYRHREAHYARQDAKETLKEDEVMLYLDPFEGVLAAAVPSEARLCSDGKALQGTAGAVSIDRIEVPLEEALLTPKGLVHPAVTQHAGRLEEVQRENALRMQEYAERRERAERRARERDYWEAEKAHREGLWKASDLYGRVQTGELPIPPVFLDEFTNDCWFIYAAPAHWKAFLWDGFIHQSAVRVFTLDNMVAALAAGGFPMDSDRLKVGNAILWWLSLLRKRGVVSNGDRRTEFVVRPPT